MLFGSPENPFCMLPPDTWLLTPAALIRRVNRSISAIRAVAVVLSALAAGIL
jgi:hypothetical protein